MSVAEAERGIAPSPLRGLPPEQRTLPALLTRQAAIAGDRPLLRIGDTHRDCREMADAVAAAAGRLAEAGIQAGDRCALMCSNRVELLDLVLGCAWLGAIAVPLNTALRGAGLAHQLTDSGAGGLVIDTELLAVLDGLAPAPSVEFVWALDGVGERPPAAHPLRAAPADAPPMPAAAVGPGDTAAILYTSGTSGVAKGVCCPHAQFHWWGVLVSETLGVREGDVLSTSLPLFHTNALNAFVQALVAGATFHVEPRFSASRFWERLVASQATVTYLLGAMVSILAEREPGPDDRAHRARVALAPGSPEPVFRRFKERFGITLVEGYGSTETNCPISVAPERQRPGWMGQVRAGFHARVVDADDAELPDGTPGELVLRHDEPFAFATGYFGNDPATVRAWRNLWFHTGDQVVRDGEGWLRFTDRLTDAIRRRGENISSFEVEQALVTHPDVAAVAAYPLAAALGEDEVAVAVVVACDRPAPAGVPDPVALVRWCEPRLAYFAIPRYITFVEALPVTENGKVRKAQLREQGVTAQTWDREAAGVVVSRRPVGPGGSAGSGGSAAR